MTAGQIAKRVGWKVAPRLMPVVMHRRADWLARRNGTLSIRNQIVAATRGVVQAGPFQGMRYLDHSVGSVLTAKLLGSYEMELHEAIESLCRHRYEEVLDVGCAEGYYAVGLARRLPGHPRVVAYDIDPYARLLLPELAELNGVTVELGAFCDQSELARLKGRRALVVSDCEGYEFILLGGDAPQLLADADLVVELHGPYDALLESYRSTHRIEVLKERPRNPELYSLLDQLAETDRRLALSEGRGGPTPWAVMRSLAHLR